MQQLLALIIQLSEQCIIVLHNFIMHNALIMHDFINHFIMLYII